MEKATIFELIRTAELLNDQTLLYFMNNFDKEVGFSQILVLHQLRERGAQKPTQLAKILGYSPGAMTGLADKLIQEGYSVREYSETDRRIILLSITNEGHKLLEEAQEQGQVMRERLYSVLNEEEINRMLDIQRKLLNHVIKLNDVT